jgi:hypothetical protein
MVASAVEIWIPDTSRFAPLARKVGNDGGGRGIALVSNDGVGDIAVVSDVCDWQIAPSHHPSFPAA